MGGKRLGVVAVLATVLAVTGLLGLQPAGAAPSNEQLALHWAPVHYQDVDAGRPLADLLAPLDFDGDWTMSNNQQNFEDHEARRERHPLKGTAYWSVVESETHWYPLYAFFHPLDWKSPGGHENDMEGVLLVVRKNGSRFGVLEAMVTVAHRDFFSYTPKGGRFRNGHETIDGPIVTEDVGGNPERPTTYQEPKGHGLYSWGPDRDSGTLVRYVPTTESTGQPAVRAGGNQARYQLVRVFDEDGLWAHRRDPHTFASCGTFRGDGNKANAPWGWDDHDDGPYLTGNRVESVERGEMATDPAHLVSLYFSNTGTLSRTYASNIYREDPNPCPPSDS